MSPTTFPMPTMLDCPIRMNTLTGFDISAGDPPSAARPAVASGTSATTAIIAILLKSLFIVLCLLETNVHARDSRSWPPVVDYPAVLE